MTFSFKFIMYSLMNYVPILTPLGLYFYVQHTDIKVVKSSRAAGLLSFVQTQS